MITIKRRIKQQMRYNTSDGRKNYKPYLKDKKTTFVLADSDTKEYIPIYAIELPDIISGIPTYGSTGHPNGVSRYLYDAINVLSNEICQNIPVLLSVVPTMALSLASKPSNSEICQNIKGTDVQVLAKKFIKASLIAIKKSILVNISHTLPDVIQNNNVSIEYGNNYADIFRNFNGGAKWSNNNLRTMKYRTTLGTIWEVSRTSPHQLIPLVVTVTQASNVPYILLCMLFEEEPISSVYECWVSPELDVVRGRYNLLRPHYRKNIKRAYLDANIPIITKENIITELYDTVSVPSEITSIKGRKEWLHDMGVEIKEHLLVTQVLNRDKRITLCV